MKSPVIIDANIAIYSVLNTPRSAAATHVLEELSNKGYIFHAPKLWWYEVTSVIHRYRFLKVISDNAAHQALSLLVNEFNIQPVDVPVFAAFNWAHHLRQKTAYDGFYLAAAEQLQANFWTADQALCHNTRQLGIEWVHWVEDIP